MTRDGYPKDRQRFDTRSVEIKSVTKVLPLLEDIVKAYFSKKQKGLHELMLEASKVIKEK